MGSRERILKPVKRLSGAAALPHLKATAELETVVMPPVAEVKIPLQQHIGAPAVPIVKKGDKVFVGTLIANSGGFVSAPVHSSVSGTVKEISPLNGVDCIVIESDGLMEKDPDLKPFAVKNPADIAAAAEGCGLVGLGGAGFPAKVKLSIKEGAVIDTLIINAAECEPYITSDYRECLEGYDDVIEGIYLLKDILKIENVIICVESNKKKAIKKLYEIATDKRDAEDKIKLMQLPTQYPQGAEKVIIYSATGRRVPSGKLPSDVGCIVMNVTSVATLYRFISTGMPLVAKRITVDGNAVAEPKNLIVPIGTPIKSVLEFVGGIADDADEIIMGGPMMGVDVCNADAVVEKRNNAITVMKSPAKPARQTACIRCGRCANTCPMNLYPATVEATLNSGSSENLKNLNINYCMECGSCSFVCPASRPLTQSMRLAKAVLRRESNK
ncbi:MAG: electron transport complex subunit RsxC [Clostridia bacterium]|nr:electron transport complex subunit RsxC [Clostridia bacterium]